MLSSKLNPITVEEERHLTKKYLFNMIGQLTAGRKEVKISFVTDNAPIQAKNDFFESIKNEKNICLFDTVQPNPRVSDIMKMFNDRSFKNSEIVIGIGGGSVLDSAKALAMLATNGGSLEQYLSNTPERKITKKNLPLILIPTTAGTGSEVTKVGVYTSESGRKYTLGSPLMHAHKAILIQDFILHAPSPLVASTGLDALDHALESIWNKNANEETLELSRQATIEVLENLKNMYDHCNQIRNGKPVNEDDYSACKNMLHASCKAGMAFNLTGTAAGHSLSFVLSETWHVPHGTACAFTLNGVYKLAIENPKTRKNLALISSHFHKGEKDEKKLVALLQEDISNLYTYLKQPKTFKDLGIDMTVDKIDDNFERSFDDPKMHNQLPVATKMNIYPILEELC